MILRDPKEFSLTSEERLEKERGYLGLSMRDRKIVLQVIDNICPEEIIRQHNISMDELRSILKKRAAVCYRQYEERQLLNRYGYTRENVIRGLCDIAFSKMDDIADWDSHSVKLRDSDFVSPAAKNAVSEVQATYFKGEKVVRIKMHDKLSALNSLLRTFDQEEMKNDELDATDITRLLEILNASTKKPSEKNSQPSPGGEDEMETVPGSADACN